MLNRVPILAIVALLLAGCGGGGGGLNVAPGNHEPGPQGPAASDHVEGGGMALTVIRDTSGTPTGVTVSWTRFDDPKATGYYIYRDIAAIPGGDPAGQQGKRINSGNKINQSGSGTQTLTFDDVFNPPVGNTYFYRMTVVNDTSDESDMSNQLSITIAQQTITNVTQAGGSIGDQVTITGTNFGQTRNGDQVFFSNSSGTVNVPVVSTDYVSWGPTQIVVKIPYGAADGHVGVQIGGVLVSSSQNIAYNEPHITTVAPSEDWVQHNYVVLTGNDFGPPPSTGGSSTFVYFGGTQAQVADIDESSWTTTQIKVKVPAAATGETVQIKVSLAGNLSNLPNFMILPHIDSLNNSSGNTGAAVTITGTNFGATQSTGTVTVGGITAAITSWGNASIQITIPSNAVDGNIVVNRDDTKSSNGVGYDVIPTITSISPARRVVGENLTINGTGFGDTQNGSIVRFLGGAGVDASAIVSWTKTQIVVTVPTGSSTGAVKVTINDASVGANLDSATSSSSVTVVLGTPNLTGVGQI